MNRPRPLLLPLLLAATGFALTAPPADAFCGFYVAKADAKLFNKSSQVVLVRDDDKTVLTMVNDYQGSLKEFAVVIPVPTAITREQIHIGDKKVVDHLDAFSGPRLVEYFDEDPCEVRRYREEEKMMRSESSAAGPPASRGDRARALGVTIEASYTVGEYDILILSALQSDGLQTWLTESGYRMPDGAGPVLGSYIKQKMKFFVAKVNLAAHDKLGGGTLRPIQVAYESPKFMLPIRLGTVNANGTQDLVIYAITRSGRVESTNYRTVKVPSDVNVPEYTKDVFGEFYKALFAEAVRKNDGKAVFTEYAWDMSFCDPCAAEPLTAAELRSLGVFWQNSANDGSGAQSAFVTRLHVRYDRAHFPEDLVFQNTQDQSSFQGRYVMQHPFKGNMTCDEAGPYLQAVYERQVTEAKTLADLTGWQAEDIRRKMNLKPPAKKKSWYQKIWSE